MIFIVIISVKWSRDALEIFLKKKKNRKRSSMCTDALAWSSHYFLEIFLTEFTGRCKVLLSTVLRQDPLYPLKIYWVFCYWKKLFWARPTGFLNLISRYISWRSYNKKIKTRLCELQWFIKCGITFLVKYKICIPDIRKSSLVIFLILNSYLCSD